MNWLNSRLIVSDNGHKRLLSNPKGRVSVSRSSRSGFIGLQMMLKSRSFFRVFNATFKVRYMGLSTVMATSGIILLMRKLRCGVVFPTFSRNKMQKPVFLGVTVALTSMTLCMQEKPLVTRCL